MWLINATAVCLGGNAASTYLEDFTNRNIPPYAILSHTWEEDEVSFQSMQDPVSARRQRGFQKILHSCQQARKDRLEYVWADTACINKQSSAELQEAINSMFRWYENAEICYAYLSDIVASCPSIEDIDLPFHRYKWFDIAPGGDDGAGFWIKSFARCKWFTRGWTLQELLAPRKLNFYGQAWNYLGSKSNLNDLLAKITNVYKPVLTGNLDLWSVSAARRMSWASRRQTTRIEDRAYSLLGIFGVSLPMLYGEGINAFKRLQEEIMKVSNDHSILAWQGVNSSGRINLLLADSPADFVYAQDIRQWARPDSFEMTNKGLRIPLRVIVPNESRNQPDYLGILHCQYRNDIHNLLAIRLRKYPRSENFHVMTELQLNKIKQSGEDISESWRSSNQPRIVTVPLREAEAASVRNIIITRGFERDRYRATLIFELEEERTFLNPVKKSSTFPAAGWTFPSRDVCTIGIVGYPSIRAGIQLRSRTGGYFYIAFGLDVIKITSLDDARPWPGLKIQYSPSVLIGGIDTFCTIWKPCSHSHECLTNGCPNMPSSTSAKGGTDDAFLKANICMEEILGETVCTVTARLS